MKLSVILTAALALATLPFAQAQTELQTQPNVATPLPASPAMPTQAPLLSEQPVRYHASTLSIEAGWGAPYGWGLSYAYLVAPNLDLNAGLGIGVGGKIGVGLRYYLQPQRELSPYLGLNLARTGRLDNVEIELNQERAVYSMAPSGVLHLRGGLRWQPGRLGMLASFGYGVRFTGNPISYQPGPTPSPELQNVVKAISPGGLEISLGLAINLGPR
ncbi:hypothetical protein FY528_05650 [Hymenobacter lutimineralis]|uniref:Porin family protein n=1 Tax=Hymenobacter lutimineralis TaxID=2606448 RepID=A0A5D6V9K1_9BACT|nr:MULTISPECIES: hypothetical protein [Hymenobacter]QIX62596.1 hypothetical protein HER32_16005 [Hymenobacter sp. BT18]TYZ11842.1 hypothetical protein FY528_05650 [Hymenobacter lutimineralis]